MASLRPPSISRRVAASITAATIFVSGATLLVMYLAAARELDAGLSRKADEAREYLVGALELPLWSLDRRAADAACRAFAQNDLVVKLLVRDDADAPVCDIDRGPDPGPLPVA